MGATPESKDPGNKQQCLPDGTHPQGHLKDLQSVINWVPGHHHKWCSGFLSNTHRHKTGAIMYSYANQTLLCNRCNVPTAAYDLLRLSRSCSPVLSVLYTSCPHCQARLEVKVEQERLSVGSIDGFPGPCFIVNSTSTVAGLTVEALENGIHITHEDQDFYILLFSQVERAQAKASASSSSRLPLPHWLLTLLRLR